MITKFTFTALAAAIFTDVTGSNFRVRFADNVVSIKPSTRPRQVKTESGFGKFDLATLTGLSNVATVAGTFSLEAGKYGWYKLIPGEGVELSLVEAPVAEVAAEAAAVAEVPAVGEVAVVNAAQVLDLDTAAAQLGTNVAALKKRIARGTVVGVRNDAGTLIGVQL